MLPDSAWFPWEEVVEEDRGYGTVCWVWTRPLPPTGKTVSVRKKAKRLFAKFVGEKQPGQVWMHLCERYGEPNLCVRPDHIAIATKSANMAHWHALRCAAGDPPNISQAQEARIGTHHTLESRRKIAATRHERYGHTVRIR